MKAQRKIVIRNFMIAAVFIVIASILRKYSHGATVWAAVSDVVVFSIYVGLLAAWGVALSKRINHRKVRHYLFLTLFLMLFWIFIRTIRHSLLDDGVAARLCWYGYYIAQLGMVAFAYMTAVIVSKDENAPASAREHWILIPSCLLLIGILTNDYHHMAFSFAKDGSTIHHWLYYVVIAWMIGVCVASIVLLEKNYKRMGLGRHPKSPYIVLALTVVYMIFYLIDSSANGVGVIELTAAFCFAAVALWESLIAIGVVPSNTDYDWCFTHSSLNAQILNDKDEVVYASKNPFHIPEEICTQAKNSPVILSQKDRDISLSPFPGGYIAREQDVSEINSLIEELSETETNLKNALLVLQENIRAESRKKKLSEQNRLYDLIISNIDHQLDELQRYINEAEHISDEEFRNYVWSMNGLGIYIKRKCNLVLLSEMEDVDVTREAAMSFKETFDHLKRADINADFVFYNNPELSLDIALLFYDLLETVLEDNMRYVSSVLSIVSGNGNEVHLMIHVCCIDSVSFADEHVLQRYAKWKEVVEEQFSGSFDMETEQNTYTLSVSVWKGAMT